MSIYYQIVPSKMKKTKILIKNSSIVPYIPKTLYLSSDNLKEMLNQFSKVFFKPDLGRRGRYAGLISRTDEENKYNIHYLTSVYENMTINKIVKFIQKLAPNKKFLIQQNVDLIKYDSNPVDVRLVLQKPIQVWKITGIMAKIAAKNKIVTNLHNGGTGMLFKDFMQSTDYSEEDIKKLKKEMVDIATKVVNTLCKVYPHLRELGFDFGIDSNLHPWILEINTYPGYSGFKHLRDKSMYSKITKYRKLILQIR